MSTLDVICVGSATSDVIAAVPWVPVEDERILASRMIGAGGGPAATAAVTLARLGLSVGFCGVVGDDEAGREVYRGLSDEGVQLDWLQVDPNVATAQSVVLASERSGGRSIVTADAPAPRHPDVPTDASTWLHADQTGFVPLMRALGAMTDRPRVSVDGGNHISALDLHGVDVYAPTLSALTSQYGGDDPVECLRSAADAGAALVVATDGGNGTYVLTSLGDVVLVPAFEVGVVSSLGAGDVFHGALLAGLVRSLGLEQAVGIANAAAALSCSALDGRSGIPSAQELADFLRAEGHRPTSSWPFRAE